MNSPTDKLSPQMTDDERREAMARYRRDYYAPIVKQRRRNARNTCDIVAMCIIFAALCGIVGACIGAVIGLWRA